MTHEHREALLQELITLHTQTHAVIEQLIGPKASIEASNDGRCYVHAEQNGATTECYQTVKACQRLRKQPWDVLIDEPQNMVVINDTAHELLYLTKMKRVMLWLAGEHYGRRVTEADIRKTSGTLASDIYQFPRHLKAVLGSKLKDTVIGVKRGVSYPIYNEWNLCWIRAHQIAETSDLLIGTPRHRSIQ